MESDDHPRSRFDNILFDEIRFKRVNALLLGLVCYYILHFIRPGVNLKKKKTRKTVSCRAGSPGISTVFRNYYNENH